MLAEKRWKIVSYVASTGSKYIVAMQGFKRVVIRIADHGQSARTRRKYKKMERPSFDFHPNGTDTLADLRIYLDGPLVR